MRRERAENARREQLKRGVRVQYVGVKRYKSPRQKVTRPIWAPRREFQLQFANEVNLQSAACR